MNNKTLPNSHDDLSFDLNDRSEVSAQNPVGIPLMTVLNYSGGAQSSALLWMLIRGEIQRPANLYVLNADPGMEHRATYDYTEAMRREAIDAGIDFRTVPGPSLFDDIVGLPDTDKTRLDSPAFFTANEDGREGRLRQKCTRFYKIEPMDREVRRILSLDHGIAHRTSPGLVEKWIGFAHDEDARVSVPSTQYAYFRYPLIEMGMTRDDVDEYYADRALPKPPRSVCVACFANGLDHYRWQAGNGTDDFARACQVDDAVRDWRQIGVERPVYVSRSLVPLRVLPERGFVSGKTESERYRNSCTSGHCFL